MKISDVEVYEQKRGTVEGRFERPDVRSLYIFIVEAEANLTMLTRLHNVFSRSRIDVMDFQSVRVGDGQRVLITVRETKVTVVKLYHQLTRLVEVMRVELFAPVDLRDDGDAGAEVPFRVSHVSQRGGLIHK